MQYIHSTFIHSFILSKSFMLVSMSVDSEPIPETLGTRPALMGRQSVAVHYAHTFARLHTPRGHSWITSSPPGMFLGWNWRIPCRHKELPELMIGLEAVELWLAWQSARLGKDCASYGWTNTHLCLCVLRVKNKWRKTSLWNNLQCSWKCFTRSKRLTYETNFGSTVAKVSQIIPKNTTVCVHS